MIFQAGPAGLSQYVSVVIRLDRAAAFLRNRFSLSIYLTDMTVNIFTGEGRL